MTAARVPRFRPTSSKDNIAPQVRAKLINVSAAAGYACVSLTYCRKIGNV
jgi:hypothetical protein